MEKRRFVRRLLGLSLLAVCTGCYESSPPPMIPIETELRIGLPTGGADTGDFHTREISLPANDAVASGSVPATTAGHRRGGFVYHSPMTVIGANARLEKRESEGPTNDRMTWSLEQLQSHLQPPATTLQPGRTTFVQISEPAPIPQLPATTPMQSPRPVPAIQAPVIQAPAIQAPVAPPTVEVIDPPLPNETLGGLGQPMQNVAMQTPPIQGTPTEGVPNQGVPNQGVPGQIVPELIPTPKGEPDVPKMDTPPANENTDQDVPRLAATNTNDAPMSDAPTAPTDDQIKNVPGGLKSIKDEGTAAIPAALAPEDYSTWATPDVTLFVTGQQNGYIEPCGCTGLDKQKGGVARRYTFMKELTQQGWDLVPIDAGNQVRRVGRQASIKLSWSTEALKKMKYESVGFGPDDMRLPATDLLQLAASDGPDEATYVSANVVLFDASYMPTFKVVQRGKHRIGITNIIDPDAMEAGVRTEAEIKPTIESAKAALAGMEKQNATYKVLTFYGKEKAAVKLAEAVPGFDLLVAAGGYGEPTYQPQSIDGVKTKMIVTGNKAMYAGLVGIYPDESIKYARVPLTHEFADAPEMREVMGEYQDQLKQVGLDKLGLEPIPHPSGERFVGTATCAQCHEDAFDIWSGSMHAHATESIVSPPEDRGDVPRHFDPECLSCHVTGWNPQGYRPYTSGYLDLEASKHLHGNGCENCHGPGESHSKAERDESGVSDEEKERLRKSMQLPLERAKEHCMKCHDLDNSPDFHEPDAFEDLYWPEVEH